MDYMDLFQIHPTDESLHRAIKAVRVYVASFGEDREDPDTALRHLIDGEITQTALLGAWIFIVAAMLDFDESGDWSDVIDRMTNAH